MDIEADVSVDVFHVSEDWIAVVFNVSSELPDIPPAFVEPSGTSVEYDGPFIADASVVEDPGVSDVIESERVDPSCTLLGCDRSYPADVPVVRGPRVSDVIKPECVDPSGTSVDCDEPYPADSPSVEDP